VTSVSEERLLGGEVVCEEHHLLAAQGGRGRGGRLHEHEHEHEHEQLQHHRHSE
jgi:hypothetical protein